MNKTLKNIHLSLWSAVGMLLVLGFASIGAYIMVQPASVPSCRGGVAHVYWGNTITYANDNSGNETGSSRFVSAIVCHNRTLVRP